MKLKVGAQEEEGGGGGGWRVGGRYAHIFLTLVTNIYIFWSQHNKKIALFK